MAALTKNQKIAALVKLVQKKSRGAGLTSPPQRSVLETLMYAALLENAPFAQADLAYTVLENYYIDWNEIRVCSVRELADTLIDLPHPKEAAERIRGALQGIFEKTYMFDFEEMRKKGKPLADHIATLESMSAGSPYMIQYTAQVALDGHLIPFDEAALRIMRRLGLSQVSNDGTQEICIGLDRVILKKAALTFASQLHHFAAGYYDVPDSPELLSQLSAIDPVAVERSWAAPVLASPKPAIAGPVSAPDIASDVKALPAVPVMQAPKEKNVVPKKPAKKSVKKEESPAPKAQKKTASKPVKAPVRAKSTDAVKKTAPKTATKKVPTKTVKKTKAFSPSKALRKQKPK